MKALIYCRVSRKDQDYQRQIGDLQATASAKGWEVVEVITEKMSGAKTKRKGIDRIMQLAEVKAFDKLMVSEISRLGRSTLQVLHIIERLTELGISVYMGNYSMETIQADGKKNPMTSMLVSILTEFAVMERDSLIERTRSGLAHAKRNGTKLGRPFGTKKSREQLLKENPRIVRLLKSNRSIREVAKLADRSINTVMKVKRAMGRQTSS